MTPDPETVKAALRGWYASRRIHPAEGRRQLNAALGIPERTLERTEQTGQFPYPALLLFALENL